MELTNKKSQAIENIVHLREMIRLSRLLNTYHINTETGVAIFEQIHLMHILEKHLRRSEEVIENEVEDDE